MEGILKTPMSNYTKKEFTKLASNSMAWWLPKHNNTMSYPSREHDIATTLPRQVERFLLDKKLLPSIMVTRNSN
jgi:hypothetical protein